MKSGFGRMRRRNHSWLNRHGGDYQQRTVEHNEHGEAHRKTWSSAAPDFIPSRLDLPCHWNQLDSGERVKSTNYTALPHFNPIHCTAFCHKFIHTHSYIQVLCWWTRPASVDMLVVLVADLTCTQAAPVIWLSFTKQGSSAVRQLYEWLSNPL